jgi:RNA polymerase sigma-70 factor (ECF subfamily)
MFRIMQNAWIDETRARERRQQTFVEEEAGENVGISTTDAQIDAIAVRKAMSKLGDDHRVVIALVLVEGLPYQEAATVLGIPVGTVTSRLARAREALQAMLGDASAGGYP